MKLRSIEAFCVTVEEESISAAARRMYLSQPSVSERLTELEREVRAPLLERSRSGVRLTSEGTLFYEKARSVLNEMAGLRSTLCELQEKADVQLRFACCVTVGEHLLPEWLWEFSKQIPQATPSVLMGNDPVVINAIKNGDMPFGIVATDKGYEAFESTVILEDDLIVVVAPQHPWARRRIVADDLSDEPFVSREQGSTVREVIEQTLGEEYGVSLNVRMELGNTTAVKQAIESGMGVSILSRASVQNKLEAGTLVQVEGLTIPWTFKLVKNSSVRFSKAEEDFYEFTLEQCESVKRLCYFERIRDLAALSSVVQAMPQADH